LARHRVRKERIKCLTGVVGSPNLITVGVHVTPEVEKRLAALAARTGRAPEDLLGDAMPYLEELAGLREMLDGRYGDLESGRVEPIPGEDVEEYFRSKSAAARETPNSD
jgi:hypothetical protein